MMSKERKAEYDRQRYLDRKVRRTPRDPDPITLVSPEDIIYLAGLLDGEGTFVITFVNKRVMPTIALNMTHRGVVEWSGALIGATVNLHQRGSRPAHHKDCHVWRVAGRRAGLLAGRLLPHLRVKSEQASLIIELCSTIGVNYHGPSQRVPQEVLDRRLEMKARMHNLNARGTRAGESTYR